MLGFLIACVGTASSPDNGSDTGDPAADSGDTSDETGEPVDCSGDEVCDGLDNDCDGTVDEVGAADCVPSWRDDDGDGYGGNQLCACEGTDGMVSNGDDCDDANAARYTGCSDGILDEFAPVARIEHMPGFPHSSGLADADGLSDMLTLAGVVLATPEVGIVEAADVTLATLADPWEYEPGTVFASSLADYDGDGHGDAVQAAWVEGNCDDRYVCDYHFDSAVWPGPLSGSNVVAGARVVTDALSGEDGLDGNVVLRSDLDGNGDADMAAWLSIPGGEGYVWIADPLTNATLLLSDAFAQHTSSQTDVRMFELGDVDGDGFDDIFWDDGVYLGPFVDAVADGASVAISGSPSGFGSWVAAADSDGNGTKEIFGATEGDISVYVLELPAVATPWVDAAHAQVTPAVGTRNCYVRTSGDVDGDGEDEVVFEGERDDEGREVAVWDGPFSGVESLTNARTTWSVSSVYAIYGMFVVEPTQTLAMYVTSNHIDDSESMLYLQPW